MRKALILVLTSTLLLGNLPPMAQPASVQAGSTHALISYMDQESLEAAAEGPFRTHVTLRHPQDLQRVRDLGVRVLDATDVEAVVLATAGQLADLARLGFRPHQTDTLDSLAPPDDWPQDRQLASNSATDSLLAPASTDSDGDGLTDTEEAWWCTDPGNSDSDGDLVNDGDEVQALVDWISDPRSGKSSSGKPFIGWPPTHTDCSDDDQDSVPDLAETNMLGLNINRESTDRDKFDDGQELFGNTYCPGGAGACSYGYLPRDVDGGVVTPEMPSWVKAPGNHPMVAAFPEPVVEVVEDSLQVDRVVIITTEQGQMTQETHTYESSVTRGTSTSVADTITWNEWQEVIVNEGEGAVLDNPHLDTGNAEADVGSEAAGLSLLAFLGEQVLSMGIDCELDYLAGETESRCDRIRNNTPNIMKSAYAASVTAATDPLHGLWDPDEDLLQNLQNIQKCIGHPTGILMCKQSALFDEFNEELRELNARNALNVAGGQDQDGGNSQTLYDISGANVSAHSVINMTCPTPPISVTVQAPGPAHSRASAREWGGSHTTTHTEYEEHTITEGQAFTSGANWSTAWTTDTVHTADLRFSFSICNEGTDYARQIAGLIFNIYLEDDPNPIHTYNASAQIGTLSNVMPDECHTYTSDPVALTLDEFRAIDTGTNLYVVVEDYAFGSDELFYQDAVNSGVIVAIEDGYDDGDEDIDSYIVPTWGTEPLQAVMQRYFPTLEDESGNLLSIWTPEFTTPPTFYERELTGISWWNVYLSSGLDASDGFSQTLAVPGETVLFRMNLDRDRDGFNDRNEMQVGTDPDDAASYPQPVLVAGYTIGQDGDTATVLMAFLNEGNYDAYGVQAVMLSPDNTTTIGNNVIGGSGQVGAGRQVILGPRVMDPGLGNWTGTAIPYATGYYTGTLDKIYTFAADDSGTVGGGTLGFSWSDGGGSSGSLDFGDIYHAPLAVDVAEGLQVGFDSGVVQAGDSFTVEVRLPRDTMTYTINSEPYTPPVIVVSYNDPQGNHQFVTPVKMDSLQDDLSGRADEMLHNVDLSITTFEPVDPVSPNTTYYVVNNPYTETLENAHIVVSVANITGTIVANWMITQTLPPGPTIISDTWQTSVFTEAYQADLDYLLLAFWTDHEGNIIASRARRFSQFWQDPQPNVDDTPQVWDFGSVQQGSSAYREFVVANTGYWALPYMARTNVVSATLVGDRVGFLTPTESETFGLLLDTSQVGPISGTITLRTSDLDTSEITIPISGAVVPLSNLSVADDDISFDDGTPISGTLVTVTATVHNDGPASVENATVRFYLGDPLAGGTQIGDDQIIGSIGAGSDDTVGVSWVYTEGQNHIHVTVDPNDTIGETDEYDNEARAFLNVGSTLPPGGVLDEGEVVLITDPGQLVSTIVVTDGAVLLVEGVTATLTSLTVGDDAVVVLDDANLTISQISYDPMNHASLLSLENSSVVTSSQPFTVTAYRIDVVDSVMVSQGADGITGFPGTPGQPSGLALIGDHIIIREADLGSAGGDGGRGANASSGPGGNGAPGATGWMTISATASIDVYSSTLTVLGGSGGSGGRTYDNGENGGNGAPGAEAHLFLSAGVFDALSSLVSVQGGNGGNGGSINGPPAFGGAGAAAGDAYIVLNVSGETLLTSRLEVAGGDGGSAAGSFCPTSGSPCHGRSPGMGGSGTLSLFTTPLIGTPIFASYGGRGGNGGSTNNGTGGTGGTGGSATVGVTAEFLFADVISSTLQSGDGGNGGNGGNGWPAGNGGNGGDIYVQWETTLQWNSPVEWDLIQGEGGNGGDSGFPGLPGTWDVEAIDGYEAFSSAGRSTDVSDLVPNLLDLRPLDSVVLDWDGGVTATLSAPYELSIPLSQGFHTLHLHYDYTDTPPADTYHGFYVYADSADYDGDGLSDGQEIKTYDTDPVLGDTDADGLDDGDEISIRTDPLNPDSDYDGIRDSEDPDVLNRPDLTPAAPTFSDALPTEGDTITLSAIISNAGVHDSEGVVVAFFDGDPEDDGRYICADFIPSSTTSTTEIAQCDWNTSGVTGACDVYVYADPVDRIYETVETNNIAHAGLTILTKPDLRIAAVTPGESEVQTGQAISVTVVVSNTGQTDASASTLALYEGTPVTGTLVHSATVAVTAGATATITLPWTASSLGPLTLAARADLGDVVEESDEGDNDGFASVYVGWSSPVYVDAGGSPDPAYSATLGYGLVSGSTSVVNTCGSGADKTYRQGVYGQPLEYRFDHLLSSHYYHLDVTMSVCSGQRIQYLWVDGVQVAGPLTTTSTPLRHSELLASGTYTDHSVVVGVTASGLAAPAVAELTLTDIYYCYRDSGSSTNDPAYSADIVCGYYDPLSQASDLWGSAPTQTVRFDPNDSDVIYRFSGLEAGKSYQVNLTLFEGDGAGRQQTVRIDGDTVGPAVTLSSQPQYLVVSIPPEAYASDGTVDVAVVETTDWNAPVVSEIAVEQVTMGVQPAADFTAAPRSGVYPLTVSFTDASTGATAWAWTFGDGGFSAQQHPTHTYTAAGIYTVSLSVTGSGGSDILTRANYITVTEPPPVADFTAAPLAGQLPLDVQFTDQSSGSVDTWLWEFGDGATSAQQSPTHTYAITGTFTVTLTVSGLGGSDSEVKVDYIEVGEGYDVFLPLVLRAHVGGDMSIGQRSELSRRVWKPE